MTALIKFEDLDIAALKVIAAEQYEECLWAIEKALDKQLAFGRLLRIVKAKLPHGEWGTWVRSTFTDHKSLRTIQRYMRGADSIATDPSLLECADSLDGILKIVEERKPNVNVIEEAVSVPEVAVADSVDTDDADQIPAQVATPKTTHSETPAAPSHQAKSKSLDEIKRALFRMMSSKKRREEIPQVGQAAWDAMTLEQKREFYSLVAEKRESLIKRQQWYTNIKNPTTSGNQ